MRVKYSWIALSSSSLIVPIGRHGICSLTMAEIAPSGQTLVPVLVNGDCWIAGSWTIANYLEDRFPMTHGLDVPVGRKGIARAHGPK